MTSFAREAIKKSFFSIAEKKPIDKITVKDIVEDCGINRNSFYYHFEDLPSLIRVSIEEELKKIMNSRPEMSLEEVLDALADFILSHRQATLNIYQSKHRDLLERNFLSMCEKMVTNYFNRTLFTRYPLREEDRMIIIYYYKTLLFGILSDWINAHLNYDIKKRFRRILLMRENMADEMAQNCLDSYSAGHRYANQM